MYNIKSLNSFIFVKKNKNEKKIEAKIKFIEIRVMNCVRKIMFLVVKVVHYFFLS